MSIDMPRKNLPASAASLIADVRNDITIPYWSGVLAHADDTLVQRGGGKGLHLYTEIERDTHAFAMLQKRKTALIAREWQIEPASDAPADIAAADIVRDCLRELPFDRICEQLLDATLKGYAVAEVVWARQGARILPREVITLDPRRIVFDADWRPRLLTWTDMRNGIELPDRKFVVHRHGAVGNNPYGLGLGTRLFWPVLFKREGVTFWLHFLEKFAAPTVVGFVPYGTQPDEHNRLLNTLRNLRSSSALTAPIGTELKMLETARSGAVSYPEFLAYWDKQISICVTGETLTTDIGDSGSRAASETHAEILEMLVDADADLLSATLRNTLIQWIVDYNCPGAAVPHLWRPRPENELEAAEVRKAKAEASDASSAALMKLLKLLARIDDDAAAREVLVASELCAGLSDATIDRLVEARRDFEGEEEDAPLHPAFAIGTGSKKN